MTRVRVRSTSLPAPVPREWIGVPEDRSPYVGFVYLITSPSGMKYVGKKLFWSNTKKVRKADNREPGSSVRPLFGSVKVSRVQKESDWKKYYGSSTDLLAELKATGPEGWKREVLYLCGSKWVMAWLELKEQISRNALVDPTYWNKIIHVRLRPPTAAAIKELQSISRGEHMDF